MNALKLPVGFLLVVLLALAPAAKARNVDLSTVPDRSSVQLTIYNSEDLTLVRETRKVTFTKGANPLQFSWANTLIDPTSVELQFLDHKAELDVLETTYPHDKPQMLYWNVQSDYSGEATVEISYFTSGLSWQADYTAISNTEETKLHLEGFVRVTNHSGEDYEDAQVRLVVGKVNLVEMIETLARRPVSGMTETELRSFKRDAADKAFGPIGISQDSYSLSGGMDNRRDSVEAGEAKPKEIIKEGLSEYFIYTIDGTETIRTGWSKRLRSIDAADVPFEIVYRFRPLEYGDRLVRLYIMTNDKDSMLGTTPLPNGVVRVFRRNGNEGLSYLWKQTVKYIPIGDKIELNLGVDREVEFKMLKVRVRRDNLWLRVGGIDVLRKVEGGIQVEDNSPVVGWDEHMLGIQRIRNFTPKPIAVELRLNFSGDVTFRSELNPTQIDFQTIEFASTVKPGERQELPLELIIRQGTSARQNRVVIEAGKPTLER